MAIVDDLPLLERLLNDLVTRYEQYFIGLEKREPLPQLAEVEKIVRRYIGTPITNTMYKHRYTMLVARFNTYREHWNRIVRLMEEGKYSRDRFISDLHRRQETTGARSRAAAPPPPQRDNELERVYQEFREARTACNLPVDKLNRDMVAATIEKSRPALAARLGTDDLRFRVVVENGKPKIKAGRRT
ncbi:MAG TPA: MXAN_5187 C-terminal domain-containing protein [Desulfuromonadaceae bacterium]